MTKVPKTAGLPALVRPPSHHDHGAMTTTATPIPTSTVTESAATAAAAVALLDQRLAEWGQAGRSVVTASEVIDLALDLRSLLTP